MPAVAKYRSVKPGDRFGKLVALSEVTREQSGKFRVYKCVFRCDCGTERKLTVKGVLYGTVVSCGCRKRDAVRERNTTHGDTRSRLYSVYRGMIDRCGNPNRKTWPDYGGRGIRVCDEWRNDFAVFRDWALANGYHDGLTIERKDNDGHYEPGNCVWIPFQAQASNRRSCRWVEAFGERKLLRDWLGDPRCCVTPPTLYARLADGMTFEAALATPGRSGRHHRSPPA